MNCPKCNAHLNKQTDKGPGKGPNKGHLVVMEMMDFSTEGFDFEIEWWKCPECGADVYISE